MNNIDKISSAISNLLNEIGEENPSGIMRWHNELFNMGSPAIPLLRKNMLEINNINLKQKHKHQYIINLAGVLHDIDEQSCKDVTIELVNAGCERPLIASLRGINEFTRLNFLKYKIRDIPVYQSNAFRQTKRIRSKLSSWLTNIDDDIKNINRIYIIKETKRYSGNFMPIYSIIKIVWYDTWNPIFRWKAMICNEHTLYHEIGHYVKNHTFGEDLEQEEEADKYAEYRIKEAHPILSKIFIPYFRFSRFLYQKGIKNRNNPMLQRMLTRSMNFIQYE